MEQGKVKLKVALDGALVEAVLVSVKPPVDAAAVIATGVIGATGISRGGRCY